MGVRASAPESEIDVDTQESPVSAQESRRRLLVLADFLETLPPERFDYGRWAGESWKGKPDLSCGTTACALGWATTIPEFRKLGLRLYRKPGAEWTEVVLGKLKDIKIQYMEHPMGTDAAEAVFGLDYYESRYLFMPGSRLYDPDDEMYDLGLPTGPGERAKAKAVAKHIRRFVRRRRPVEKVVAE